MMRSVAVADNSCLTSALDNLLVSGSEIFIDLGIKRGVRKLPQSFFLVEVGPTNNRSAAFVGRFDNYVSALTSFFSAAISSEEKLENLVLRLKLSLLMSNLKRRTGPLGESTSIFELEASRK